MRKKQEIVEYKDSKGIIRKQILPKAEESGKRFEYLANEINKNKFVVGAEIGVNFGVTTKYLLKHCKDLKRLFAVDLFAPVPDELPGGTIYKDWDFISRIESFKKIQNQYKYKLITLKGVSWEQAEFIPDNHLDFIFVDADHEYESVKKDLLAWIPKVKKTGIVYGHDIHFEGVKKAVEEIIPNYKRSGIAHIWYCKKINIKL